jgi:hypothetical protein
LELPVVLGVVWAACSCLDCLEWPGLLGVAWTAWSGMY